MAAVTPLEHKRKIKKWIIGEIKEHILPFFFNNSKNQLDLDIFLNSQELNDVVSSLYTCIVQFAAANKNNDAVTDILTTSEEITICDNCQTPDKPLQLSDRASMDSNLSENLIKPSDNGTGRNSEIGTPKVETEADTGKDAKDYTAPIKALPPALTPQMKNVEQTTNFSLSQNGKVGEKFNALIMVNNSPNDSIYIIDIEQLPEGLFFDQSEGGKVCGTPVKSGEFDIVIVFRFDAAGGEKPDIRRNCRLVINPDPKTLWQEKEPEENQYRKQHTDQKLLLLPEEYRIVAASKRGRSHAHSALFRDDDFYVHYDSTTKWSILAVGDGAGSSKFSREASRIAVNTAGETILSLLTSDNYSKVDNILLANNENKITDMLYNVFSKASYAAVKNISQEAENQNENFKSYLSTLLISIHKHIKADSHFVGSFWVGDGGIAIYRGANGVVPMGKADSGEFAGQTTFLDKSIVTDEQAIRSRIKFEFVNNFTALVVATDGITDPKFETDSNFANIKYWDALWAEISDAIYSDCPGESLLKWLDFWSVGNHDDRTICLLACPQIL